MTRRFRRLDAVIHDASPLRPQALVSHTTKMGDVPSRCFDTACLAFVRSRQSEARDCTHSTSFSTTLVMMISSARAHALLHRTRWSPVEASEFREGVLVAAFSPRCALETRGPCGRIAYLLARLQPTTDVDFALVGVSRGGSPMGRAGS